MASLLCGACVVGGGDDSPDEGATEGATDGGTGEADADADGADDADADDDGATADGVATVEGWVSSAAGDPLQGVTIAAPDGSTTTDAAGHFVLDTAADDGDTVVVELQLAGYVRGHERLQVRDEAVNVLRAVMMPEALPVPLDASAGGSVTGMRNASIIAPAGAFVRADGSAVEGMVDVHLTALNPAVAAEYDAYPGDGLARDAGGSLIQLETFGVLDVTVRQDGEELNIADGMGVEVQIPLPDPAPADPPPTMPLWSFDETEGVWAEEGVLTLDAEAGVYRGVLPHLSPWNADKPLSATCVRGHVEDPDGNPVAGAMVFAQGVDYLGGSTAVTDADGEFCVAVRKDSTVEVTAYGLDGSVTRVVDSGSADTEVPPACDEDCLDTGDWILVPGEGDPTWGGGVCTPPDEDTFVQFELGGEAGFSLALDGDAVACGFQIDDPAPAEGEPAGTTYLSFEDPNGWTVVVFVQRGSLETGDFEGGVWAAPSDAVGSSEGAGAGCTMSIDEAEEVDDDVLVVGGTGTCEGYVLSESGGYVVGDGTVDFRGIAGLWDGIIPTICCDVDMMAGVPGVPGFP